MCRRMCGRGIEEVGSWEKGGGRVRCGGMCGIDAVDVREMNVGACGNKHICLRRLRKVS
jgi:hypothetical protein